MKELESRSYSPGSLFRPRPFVLMRPESQLMIVVTSWTTSAEAERIARALQEQVEHVHDDATQVGVADASSHLRSATARVGQVIYKQDNLRQARLLFEALIVQRSGQLLSWAQVGQPNLVLVRKGQSIPLAVQVDLSAIREGLAPLPAAGLGLAAHTEIQSGRCRVEAGDQLLLLSETFQAQRLPLTQGPLGFGELIQSLIQANSDLPFWCGLVSF